MKAYELQPREGLDSLTLVNREPEALGPRDVKVRVKAVSLNYRDVVMARGAKNRKAPLVPLSDGAGEVLDVGTEVTLFRPGQRVAAAFFPTWIDGELAQTHHDHALGGSLDGMLREEVVLPETAWVSLPGHLSYEEAATLPCAGVTAFHALFHAAHLKPGDTVLVQGTGGVSLFALQLARAAGARVVLTSSSEAKRERALSLGAAQVLDYKENPKWGEAVRAFTGGRGVDIAVEVGGPGTFDQSVAALRFGGTMSLLGVLTGTKGEVNTYALFHKAIRVVGVYVGSVVLFEALNRALAASEIHPVIDTVFGFDEVRGAYEYLASGKHFGKVVITL